MLEEKQQHISFRLGREVFVLLALALESLGFGRENILRVDVVFHIRLGDQAPWPGAAALLGEIGLA